jgi:uncharacterized membrane protein YedE/YeeE
VAVVEPTIVGALAGILIGYVLQRGQLCFYSMFANAWSGKSSLLRGWLLAVAIASVGLSAIYLSSTLSKGLNTGLAFRPMADIAGGTIIGLGMLVASSCVSGLFYRLGSGMLGALVGIVGWIGGEAAVHSVHFPGPTVLAGGRTATFASLIHIPRLAVSVVFLVGVVAVLQRWHGSGQPTRAWQWDWPTVGVALGIATIAGWLLARVGHSSFGPSTVGATASVLSHHPNWWLIGFLVGIVGGAAVASLSKGAFALRGEASVQYVRLAVGGFLLGAGGWIAGGCNLGHGLSGVAQLNVSSWVVVAVMASTVGAGRALTTRRSTHQVRWASDQSARGTSPG